MRVLMVKRVGAAYGYVTDGFVNALRSVGCVVQRWDGEASTWHAFQPDLYIGCSSHKQEPPKGHKAAVAIHVNPYGPIEIPDIMEPRQAIDWTLTQKPTVVYGYGFVDDEIYWSYWKQKHGIKWAPIPTACDSLVFNEVPVQKVNDVVYLGGYWAYKAKSIDPYLFPILDKKEIKSKVMGWGEWPKKYNVQPCSEEEANLFLNSGLIGPCISEPHTHNWGIDVPERVFKIAAIGVLPIVDAVPTLNPKMPGLPIARSGAEMLELTMHYLKNGQQRSELARQLQICALKNHTYHSRMAVLLRTIIDADNRFSYFKDTADKLYGYWNK